MEPYSEEAAETFSWFGGAWPTRAVEDREIKMWQRDENGDAVIAVYLKSSELRKMAIHFIEVADWLDRRASE
jgi:hypothetical protein